MIWQEPKSHDECYFCLCNVFDYNSTNKDFIKYPDIPSITKPTPRSFMNPLPVPPKTGTSQEKNFQYEEQAVNEDDNVIYDLETIPRLYDQSTLDDLVRNLDRKKKLNF